MRKTLHIFSLVVILLLFSSTVFASAQNDSCVVSAEICQNSVLVTTTNESAPRRLKGWGAYMEEGSSVISKKSGVVIYQEIPNYKDYPDNRWIYILYDNGIELQIFGAIETDFKVGDTVEYGSSICTVISSNVADYEDNVVKLHFQVCKDKQLIQPDKYIYLTYKDEELNFIY